MNDACVLETVFVLQSLFDGVIHISRTNKRDERHHLFFGNEWIRLVGFTKQNLRIGGNVEADLLREHCRIFAHKIAIQHPVSTRFFRRREGRFCECIYLTGVQSIAAVSSDMFEQFVED